MAEFEIHCHRLLMPKVGMRAGTTLVVRVGSILRLLYFGARIAHHAVGTMGRKLNSFQEMSGGFLHPKNKTPVCASRRGFRNSILTMTYSHMGKPHTTIGDASFH
ncbi:hypothetical protein, partial [Pseudomonas batumici]|uniref:hypothetical protein n=1 Tax=Pseudomonas batumici TaxID=226910 RepID=UPI001ADF2256